VEQGTEANAALGPALFSSHGHHHHAASVLPVRVTDVTAQSGQLFASGLIENVPFTAPLDLQLPTTPAASPLADPTTPILNLHVGAIHLDLLGLKVDRSDICLAISAQTGPGNLLGNLLSDISHLLDGGLSLSNILGSLSSVDLTNGIQSLLNGVFGQLTAPAAASPSATSILHLSLGPVDLNLLGLKVHLDNCNNGPITLDVSAQPGPGNLLGNLLSGLTGVLDNTALARLARELLTLL
jgi:hypothetical protein